jgi:3-oxo-5-alpha-steroid 4-dehydrogenase 3
MHEHESQVSAIFSALGGASTTDASGGIGNVEHLAKSRGRAWGSFLLLAMLEAQILRRIFENVHLFHFSPLARMHVLGYLVGMG